MCPFSNDVIAGSDEGLVSVWRERGPECIASDPSGSEIKYSDRQDGDYTAGGDTATLHVARPGNTRTGNARTGNARLSAARTALGWRSTHVPWKSPGVPVQGDGEGDG